MMFYNQRKLHNLLQQEELESLHRKGMLNNEQLAKALAGRQPSYKRTNVFIRIGFFILTTIVAASVLGLLALASGMNQNFELLLLFFSIGVFFVLYYYYVLVEQGNYGTGVDDALLYFGLFSFLTGLLMLINLSHDENEELKMAIITFPFLLISAILFIDKVLSALSFACFIAISFLLISKFGEPGKMLMPFLLMGISLAIYLYFRKLKKAETLHYWKNCLQVVECLALLTLYASGNYLVVRELSTSFFDLKLGAGEDIPFALFFYAFTIVVPLVYVLRGLKQKDYIQLNTGLVLIAAAVGTIRYYHSLMPLEAAMLMGGILLITLVRASYQYLKTPKFGITAAQDEQSDEHDRKQAEALVLTETKIHAPVAEPGFNFEGGKFGGGGAGGSY